MKKLITILFLFFVLAWSNPAKASLSGSNINNVQTQDQWSAIGSLSYNSGTGSNRILVAIITITFSDSNSVSSVTYNGAGLTCTTKAIDPYDFTAIYVCYHLAPASGSNTFDLTSNDDDVVSVVVFYVSGANTSLIGTIGSANNADSSSQSASITPSATGSLLIGGLGFNDSGTSGNIVAGGDTTEFAEVGLAGLQDTWGGWETSDGGAETLNSTSSGGDGWVMRVIEILEAPAATTPTRLFPLQDNW